MANRWRGTFWLEALTVACLICLLLIVLYVGPPKGTTVPGKPSIEVSPPATKAALQAGGGTMGLVPPPVTVKPEEQQRQATGPVSTSNAGSDVEALPVNASMFLYSPVTVVTGEGSCSEEQKPPKDKPCPCAGDNLEDTFTRAGRTKPILEQIEPCPSGPPLSLTVEERVDQKGLIPAVPGGRDADLLNPRFPRDVDGLPLTGALATSGGCQADVARQRQALRKYQQDILRLKDRCGFKADVGADLLNNRYSVKYWPVRPLISTLGPNELYLTTGDFSTPIINPFEPRTPFYTQPLPGSDRYAGLSTSEAIAQVQHNYDRTFVDRVPDVGFSPSPYRYVPGMDFPTQGDWPPANGYLGEFSGRNDPPAGPAVSPFPMALA